ncbi:MAG: hypothetical protein VCA55_05030 [Verrucomicrobiales bacterium]
MLEIGGRPHTQLDAVTMFAVSRVITVLLLATAMNVAPALAGQPPELRKLINIYERQKRSLEITAISRHLVKLRDLASTLTKSDYAEDAALVNSVIAEQESRFNKLIKTAAQPPPPAAGAPNTKGSTVYLKAAHAKLRGGLQNSYRYIRNWTTPDCSASWSRRGIIPGRYHIQVTYIPVSGGGGEIQVRELDQLTHAKIPGTTRSRRFKKSLRIGTFNLRQSINLEVRPRTSNSNGVFLLTEVRLIPAR